MNIKNPFESKRQSIHQIAKAPIRFFFLIENFDLSILQNNPTKTRIYNRKNNVSRPAIDYRGQERAVRESTEKLLPARLKQIALIPLQHRAFFSHTHTPGNTVVN